MPEGGVSLTPSERLLTLGERKRLLDFFVDQGVSKIRFTGGEPTISKDLLPLVAHAAADPRVKEVCMTSNGVLLQDRLDDLKAAGLTSANISLDTLVPEKFAKISRRNSRTLERILRAVRSAVQSGLRIKLNCVLVRGVNDDEIVDFVSLTRDAPLDVRFIELMPFGGNQWERRKMLRSAEVRAILLHGGVDLLPSFEAEQVTPRVSGEPREPAASHAPSGQEKQEDENGTDPSDTTKWYQVSGHQGRVGFISSMSQQFCSGCNRLRVTADGQLKACLFGTETIDMIPLLRVDERQLGDTPLQPPEFRQQSLSWDQSSTEGHQGGQRKGEHVRLRAAVESALSRKHAALGGFGSAEGIAQSGNAPMILIGG
jgi:cyclic pyranopterin phosphate synthase